MRELLAVAVGASMLLPSGAGAQEPGRYRLERSDNGYVRMDTATGAMSLCQERDGRIACAPAADQHAADENELKRLHDRIEALEARVDRLENAAESRLPSEEEFEKSLGFMERFFRRFMDIVQDMEQDQEQREPPQEQAPSVPGESRT